MTITEETIALAYYAAQHAFAAAQQAQHTHDLLTIHDAEARYVQAAEFYVALRDRIAATVH